MKKIFIVLFVLISIAQPQAINKVVKFTDSETVDRLTESENYVGATIAVNSFQALPRAILFNKNGDIVFEIDDPERSEFIVAEPVESLGYFITVRRGGGKVLDQIRAFDLKTGQKVWETYANACSYELSPNKLFMITVGDPGTERVGNFEIIDLKDGSKVDFGYKYNQYCATWLDDERIVFVFQEWENNIERDTINDPKSEYLNNKMKLKGEKFKLEYQYNNGLITKSKYDEKKNELNKLEEELQKNAPKIKKTSSGRGIPPYKISYNVNPKTIKIIIYNLKTSSNDREEYLYKGDGSKIHIGPSPNGSKTINVDNEKNIYIYGYDTVENDRQYYLVKFSQNLDYIWTTKTNIANLVSFFVDDDIYFRSMIIGDVNLIDTDTGELIPIVEAQKNNLKVKDIEFSYHYKNSKVKILKNVNIDYQNKAISFTKVED